jgi:hypothetical protein
MLSPTLLSLHDDVDADASIGISIHAEEEDEEEEEIEEAAGVSLLTDSMIFLLFLECELWR